jgi:capsid protein
MGLSGLLSNYSESNFVPVGDIEHGRRIQRAGQVRGVSSLAPVLVALHELDNYEQAEQTRKLIEACLTAFVIQPDDDGQSLGSVVQDANGNSVESFEPGMIAYLRGGKQVQVSEPKPAGGYAEYMRTRHRVIAAGVGMPYEVLTNDYSQSNYSSSRMGLVSFKKITEHLQWSVAIPFFGNPVWRRFVDNCVVAGIVPANTGNMYQVQWAPPPFDLLDREAEALADLFELRIGKKTWAQLVGEQGEDPAKQADTIAHWNKVWDDLGLIFDCDARKSSRTGIAQKAHEDAKTAPNNSVQQGLEPREAELLAAALPPQVLVSQSPAPNVNVSSPEIHMTAPNVTYNAPPVNVSTSPINLRIGALGKRIQQIKRDERGRIAYVETQDDEGVVEAHSVARSDSGLIESVETTEQ